MMKRSALAVAVALIVVSGATQATEIYNKDGNQLDLYGRVNGKHFFSKDKSNDGDKTYVRFGFKGQTKINDTLTGYGQWEYQAQANNAETQGDEGNKTRLGFAGLKFGQWGSFDYGRNYGVVYDAIGYTDMLPEFGGDTANSDNFMVGRSSGLATYRNKNFFGLVDGLNIALQYQGKNDSVTPKADDNNNRPDSKSNGDGFGGSLAYEDIGGTGIGAVIAGSSSDRTSRQKASVYGKGDRASAWATGLKYDANQIYLAAMFNQTTNQTAFKGTVNGTKIAGYANKTQGVELVAQYQFENGLRPSIAYVQSKAKDIENGIGDVDLVKYYDIGATYYFNKNMYTYVDYQINALKDNNKLGLSNKDVVAVSLTYRF